MATRTGKKRKPVHAEMPPLYRFTIEQYERMAETGIIDEDDRTELIEGVIYQMSALGNRHVRNVNRLNTEVTYQTYGRAAVSVQNPVRLPPRTEPGPDLVVMRLAADGTVGGIPSPEDVLLMIEVADSSLSYDLHFKASLYAGHNIPELWVWDVVHRQVHVFRDLKDGTYQERLIAGPDDVLEVAALPGVRIGVGAILGPEES